MDEYSIIIKKIIKKNNTSFHVHVIVISFQTYLTVLTLSVVLLTKQDN